MTAGDLDDTFDVYLARDDDALTGRQFFELLAEIERRRVQETIDVTMRVVKRAGGISTM
jgi:hypothetical protein